MTKAEASLWLKEFLNRIDTQDRRATAHPVQFLLQRKREYVAHPEYNHKTDTIYRHHEMESTKCKTHAEAVEWLKEFGYEGDKLEEEIGHIEEFQMGHHWETDQAFFTEEGVKQHIELNGHNLGEHRDYVVHAFRNPEVANLFKAIRAVVDDGP